MSGANIKRLMDPEILAAIMDSATDGFTYTDETGYIVYNNRAYSEMTGLPDEKIQGHNIHQLVKEGFPISRMMLEVFQSRETRSELIKYQADSERLLLVTLSPVYSPDGRFRGAVGNVRDMTELMQLRQQMDITYLDYDREMQVKEKANRELVQHINEMLHLMEDYDIVGRSKAMHNLAELALRVSHVRSTVLITGESGVGKDVFCRMICRFAGSPDYIKISCGNLPENLLESELFGYEAGAFTGANRTGKRGIFELAGDGVIFLDEIGELPPQLQVKLLTVLQDRRFYRIGGSPAYERPRRGRHQPGSEKRGGPGLLPPGSLLPTQRHSRAHSAPAGADGGYPAPGRAHPAAPEPPAGNREAVWPSLQEGPSGLPLARQYPGAEQHH